jgi:signal transduction histidine kinase
MPPVKAGLARRHVRPVVYLGIAVVLAVMGALAVEEARSFEEDFASDRQRLLQQQVSEFVDVVEARLSAEWLAPVFRDLATGEEYAVVELRARRVPVLDAIYVWDRDELVYPPPAVEADLAVLRAAPCMAPPPGAGTLRDPLEVARTSLRCRTDPDRNQGLFALSEAAQALLDADLPQAALELIRSYAPATAPLTAARAAGLDIRLLAGLHLQQARAFHLGGRSDIAQSWVTDLAKELARLDGPELEHTLGMVDFPIRQDLKEYAGPTAELPDDAEELLARARRRLAAWRELQRDTVAGPTTPGQGELPRAIVDPISDPPWLVYVSRLGTGELYAAIQVDQPELARIMLSPTRAAVYSVRTARGQVLAGSSDDLLVEAPFPHLLPHLRGGITRAAMATARQARVAYAARIAPFAIALAIGFAALLALIRADRQQEILLERQRDFVARVSHELKTPLAGIRVMAETLEMGAYRDDAQRESFARRIVQEAERLTDRVNEVIRAATRPEDDVRLPTDLDEMVGAVAAAWRGRFEAAGMRFTVDGNPLGTAAVFPVQLRDALNNLLDNALKYRREGRSGLVTLRARVQGRFFVFEVEDDGLGVPVGQRKAIFERFRRVEGAGRGKSGGHGLGLAFVADTARLHGGKVECVDGVAGGAKFILRIRRKT